MHVPFVLVDSISVDRSVDSDRLLDWVIWRMIWVTHAIGLIVDRTICQVIVLGVRMWVDWLAWIGRDANSRVIRRAIMIEMLVR